MTMCILKKRVAIINVMVTRARIFFQRYARFRRERDRNAGKEEGHSNVFRCS